MGVVCPCIRAMKSREVKAVARRRADTMCLRYLALWECAKDRSGGGEGRKDSIVDSRSRELTAISGRLALLPVHTHW